VPVDPSSILLTKRAVVVTGAARGIGAATASMCARFGAARRAAVELAGPADVVFRIRITAPTGFRVLYFNGDVTIRNDD
jgi:NAD(P)-dependent dehydrogenase (short-subunit alcohol dehydrogenase family)